LHRSKLEVNYAPVPWLNRGSRGVQLQRPHQQGATATHRDSNALHPSTKLL
jgi:hypothetical protein